MAISKAEAERIEKELLEAELNKLAPIELSTDSKLSIGVRTFEFNGMSSKALEIFLGKYKSLGWTIKYCSDQRDGGYYTFK